MRIVIALNVTATSVYRLTAPLKKLKVARIKHFAPTLESNSAIGSSGNHIKVYIFRISRMGRSRPYQKFCQDTSVVLVGTQNSYLHFVQLWPNYVPERFEILAALSAWCNISEYRFEFQIEKNYKN